MAAHAAVAARGRASDDGGNATAAAVAIAAALAAADAAASEGRVAEIAAEDADGWRRALLPFIAAHRPVVIRGDGTNIDDSDGARGSSWAPDALARTARKSAAKASPRVHALVYDEAHGDRAKPVYVAELTFDEFVDLASAPRDSFVAEPHGERSGSLSTAPDDLTHANSEPDAHATLRNATLYLLFTDRQRVATDASSPSSSSKHTTLPLAMDPNPSVSSDRWRANGDGSLAADLLSRANAAFGSAFPTGGGDGSTLASVLHAAPVHAAGAGGVGGAGKGNNGDGIESSSSALAAAEWSPAWSSVRVGSAYSYPTHVDCYENLLVQVGCVCLAAGRRWLLAPGRKHLCFPTVSISACSGTP